MSSSIPDPLATDPLAAIDAMELAAWRVAQTARQLRREHPDLPVREMRPDSITVGKPELEIGAGSLVGAQEWAECLGVELHREIRDYAADTVWEHATAETWIGDVHVSVYGTRFFTPAEAEAYHADKARESEASHA